MYEFKSGVVHLKLMSCVLTVLKEKVKIVESDYCWQQMEQGLLLISINSLKELMFKLEVLYKTFQDNRHNWNRYIQKKG